MQRKKIITTMLADEELADINGGYDWEGVAYDAMIGAGFGSGGGLVGAAIGAAAGAVFGWLWEQK